MADTVSMPVPDGVKHRCPVCHGCDGRCTANILDKECQYSPCLCAITVDHAAANASIVQEMLDVMVTPETILQEAQRVVFGARQGTYGHPRDDFQRTADLWGAYLATKMMGRVYTITPDDVAYMMILLKMARLMETPNHRDSIVDIAGYAETAARVVGVDA